MKPDDLHLFSALGRPTQGGGETLAALAVPDLDADRYSGTLQRLGGDGLTAFTEGPRDSAPVISPDGHTVVFLRAGESGPAQPYAMPLHGGEPRRLAEHPLGASAVTFAPSGDAIAYLAAVPEPGRYGTADGSGTTVEAGAEPPRRINRMSYRLDGKGFVVDKPEQIFLLSLRPDAQAKPRQLTAEPAGAGRPAFGTDGDQVLYTRPTGTDSLTEEIAAVHVGGPDDEPRAGRRVVRTAGDATVPVAVAGTVYYIGAAFTGADLVGRTPGLWAAPWNAGDGGAGGGDDAGEGAGEGAGGNGATDLPAPRRLTDEHTVHVDAMAGEPVVVGRHVLVAVADRGAVSLRAVPLDADALPLDALPVVIGGKRAVKSFSCTGSRVAAVVAGPGCTGELIVVDLDGDGLPAGPERVLTDVSAELAAVARPAVELTGTAPDGYPVHGFLVLPDGDGPHPVLLAVHGGPHSAYTWAVFDEAQMYAAAGYAVVLPKPRGSAGYGQHHGRVVVGALGTLDADDVLALLDAALARADCDGERVGVMGGSYGGFMTSWLASHAGHRFVAGISERAVNAWDSFAGSSDIGYYFARAYTGADRDTQWAASPLAYAGDISIPLLIIHSEHDWRCPLEQGQRLFTALRGRGAPAEMLLFPAEGHELSRSGRPRHRQQRFEAILDWWARYLPVG